MSAVVKTVSWVFVMPSQELLSGQERLTGVATTFIWQQCRLQAANQTKEIWIVVILR